MDELKKSVSAITLSEEQTQRIMANCCLEQKEETMKHRKIFSPKKAILLAAALCLCAAGVAAAAGNRGYFSDIKNSRGAVTGTKYTFTTEELTLSAILSEDVLTAEVRVADTEAFPFRELESIGAGWYEITDAAGKKVLEGEGGLAALENGAAIFPLSAEGLEEGAYTLMFSDLSGHSKADAPLVLEGSLFCEFAV